MENRRILPEVRGQNTCGEEINNPSSRKQTTTHENQNPFTDLVTAAYFVHLQRVIV